MSVIIHERLLILIPLDLYPILHWRPIYTVVAPAAVKWFDSVPKLPLIDRNALKASVMPTYVPIVNIAGVVIYLMQMA